MEQTPESAALFVCSDLRGNSCPHATSASGETSFYFCKFYLSHCDLIRNSWHFVLEIPSLDICGAIFPFSSFSGLGLLPSLLFCFILSCSMCSFWVWLWPFIHSPAFVFPGGLRLPFVWLLLTRRKLLPSISLCLTLDLSVQLPNREPHRTGPKACLKLSMSETEFIFPLIHLYLLP